MSAPPGVSETADVVAAAVHVDESGYRIQRGMDGTYKVPSLRHARWSGLNLKDMEHGIPPLPEEALASSRHKAMMDKTLLVGTRVHVRVLNRRRGHRGCDRAHGIVLRYTLDERLEKVHDSTPQTVGGLDEGFAGPWKTYFKQLEMSKYVSKDSIK